MNEVILNNLKDIKNIIKIELESMATSCISIGFYLKQARDQELYKEDGYEDIFEFAKNEFNLGRRSVYTYISINDKCSIDGNSTNLIENYRGYGSSQLAEMLTLTDEQLEVLTPDATIKEIREYKKNIVESEEENKSADVCTNLENTKAEGDFKQDENRLHNFVDNYFKTEGKPIFEKVISTILSTDMDREEKIMYAFAPSKFRTIRIPGGTVVFNAECIHVMIIAKGKQKFTYAQLLEILEEVFHPAAGQKAEEVYKNYYGEPLKEQVPEKKAEPEKKIEKKPEKKVEPVKTNVKIEDADVPGQIDIKDIPEAQPDPVNVEGEEYEEDQEDEEENTTNQLEESNNTTEPLENNGKPRFHIGADIENEKKAENKEQVSFEMHSVEQDKGSILNQTFSNCNTEDEHHVEAEVIQTEDAEPAAEDNELQKAIEYFQQQNQREKNLMGNKVLTDQAYHYRVLAIEALERMIS